MLDLYTWPTPNGRKVPILLAELGWPYETHLVDLGHNEQKGREYLAINPNGKIPALVDTEGTGGGLVVGFESGAILQSLAEKSGKFLPTEQPARAARWARTCPTSPPGIAKSRLTRSRPPDLRPCLRCRRARESSRSG